MITDEQIIELLRPHTSIIRSWYDEALECVEKTKDVLGVEMYKRLSAMIINNYVLEKAKSYFNDYKDSSHIIIDDSYKSLVLYFQIDGTITRFKKINKDTLLSSNVETLRNATMIQGSLFNEYPPTIRIEIGYFFNEAGTEYDKILVVKRIDEYTAIPIFEILPTVNKDEVVLPAQEIEIDLSKEQQLKFNKAK